MNLKFILAVQMALKLPIVPNQNLDAKDVIVYIVGQKKHSCPTQFLTRIALLLIKDQAQFSV